MSLEKRLECYPNTRWPWDEMHKIILEYVVQPHLAGLVDATNKVHATKLVYDVNGSALCIKVFAERKKRGLFGFLIGLLPYETVVKIQNKDSGIFICEYYRNSCFSFVESVKMSYDEKVKNTFDYDFVIVSKV